MLLIIRAVAVLLFAIASIYPALAEPERHYALSLVRPPKYQKDFKNFSFVNPDAPKGGTAKLAFLEPYDNLNATVFRGSLAPGLNLIGATPLINDSLMIRSEEEAGTEYCLLCEWVSYPSDYSSVTFKLRDGAKWHDGQPITVEDVIFSMEVMKGKDPQTGLAYQPQTAQYYKNVVKGEKTGDREVTFTFDTKGNRELPHIVGELVIFPKHYWTAKAPDGKERDITKTTLEPPLGSGPYRIKSLNPGQAISYERVPNYWAANLPVRRGFNNFDVIEFQYYGDRTVSLEAFKSGQYDFNVEGSAKNWATAYDFPAVQDGRVVKRSDIVLERPKPMQGFAFNLRRPKFQDPRVRRALNLAFDFEWANQNLFYSQYKRTSSYFEGQELAATGLPSAAELALLEPLRDKVSPEVFTQEYKNPVNLNPADYRANLREAARLLKEAGWNIVNGKLQNPASEPLDIEFLIDNEQFQRVILPYIENLKKLGINATIRHVDSTEAKRREDNFDFDIIIGLFGQSESPGNEQRDFWGSAAADEPGSRNVIGIKNPAVDALIDKIIFAKNRDELVAATRALDRVLQWNNYVVMHWHAPNERVAYWNKFGSPNPLPKLTVGFPDVWWFDPALAGRNGLK
jgi:microcin C transport system substrate-binding protein